jgi:predicted permease
VIESLIVFAPLGFAIYLGKFYPKESSWYLNILLAVLVPFCLFVSLALTYRHKNDYTGIETGALAAILFSPIYWILALFTQYMARKFRKAEDR